MSRPGGPFSKRIAVVAALVLFATLLFGAPAGAMQVGIVQGQITDAQTAAPLPAVMVCIESVTAPATSCTVSDGSGLYSFAALPAAVDYQMTYDDSQAGVLPSNYLPEFHGDATAIDDIVPFTVNAAPVTIDAELDLRCPAGVPTVPANDDLASAVTSSGVGSTDSVSNCGATYEATEIVASCSTDTVGTGSVWYSYTAVANGLLTVSTVGSNIPTRVVLFDDTAPALPALTDEIACEDLIDSTGASSGPQAVATATVAAGQSYLVLVDGSGDGQFGMLEVAITGPTMPNAAADAQNAQQGSAAAVDVLANDTDPSGNGLTISSVGMPSAGGTVVNLGSVVLYTSSPTFSGTETFTYTLVDDAGNNDTATVTMTVSGANTAPSAVLDTVTVGMDSTNNIISVLSNDFDVDGDALVIVGVTNPPNGNVGTTGTEILYTPDPGFSGSDQFAYTVSDNNGGNDVASVIVTVTGASNSPPVAVGDSITLAPNAGATTIPVLTNDSDADGDTLTILSIGTPSSGTAVQIASGGTAGSAISYTPNPGFVGTDAFVYTVEDGNGGSDTALVTVTVPAPPPAVLCGGKTVTINMTVVGVTGMGTPGDDVILGTSGSDVIQGRGGDDTICGLGGDDTIRGGGGEDTIYGNAGSDSIFGGAQQDTIYGQKGQDLLVGQRGNDVIRGGLGKDTIKGLQGDDRLYGQSAKDTINGGDGDDQLWGGNSADKLNGGKGDDILRGGPGDDKLNGGDGTDACLVGVDGGTKSKCES